MPHGHSASLYAPQERHAINYLLSFYRSRSEKKLLRDKKVNKKLKFLYCDLCREDEMIIPMRRRGCGLARYGDGLQRYLPVITPGGTGGRDESTVPIYYALMKTGETRRS